jgi:AraC-like DNA-binding protein
MKKNQKLIELPELLNSGIFGSEKYVNFHSHPGTELVLIASGECEMEVDGKILQGGTGKLFILPANKEHSQQNKGFVRTIYLSFQWNELFNEKPRVLDSRSNKLIKAWMEQIHGMQRHILKNLSGAIPGLLYSLLKSIEQLENESREKKSIHPALSRALEYIDSHIDKTASLEDMAKYSGISSSYLSSLFKKQLKKAPLSALMEAKMEYAKRLLTEPYMSIKETAFACGFNDPNYFSRFFKKHHGCSPEKYKRKEK